MSSNLGLCLLVVRLLSWVRLVLTGSLGIDKIYVIALIARLD